MSLKKKSGSRRRLASPGSSSDSDSAGDESQLESALYASLSLPSALRRPPDYPTAAAELTGLLRTFYSGRCAKPVQASMVEDVGLAVASCDGRLQSRAALAELMEAAERHLPQAKRKALLAAYRRSSMALRRRERRQGGPAAAATARAARGAAAAGRTTGSSSSSIWIDDELEDEEEAAEPATFATLPREVVEAVFRYLDPLTLARAACVCREWRAAATEDALWQPHCAAILAPPGGARRGGQSGGAGGAASNFAGITGGGGGGSSGSSGGSGGGSEYRQRFAAAAAQHPGRLLQWRTNRVLVGGRRLAWLVPGQQPPPRCRHISTAAVLAYCRSWGRHAGGPGGRASDASSSTSSSGSGEGGGGGEEGRLSGQLRFWQL